MAVLSKLASDRYPVGERALSAGYPAAIQSVLSEHAAQDAIAALEALSR